MGQGFSRFFQSLSCMSYISGISAQLLVTTMSNSSFPCFLPTVASVLSFHSSKSLQQQEIVTDWDPLSHASFPPHECRSKIAWAKYENLFITVQIGCTSNYNNSKYNLCLAIILSSFLFLFKNQTFDHFFCVFEALFTF